QLSETPEQMAGRLMREAAGLQTPRSSIFPAKRRLDNAMRSMFSKLIQANKEYESEVRAMDTSSVKDLNTVESFMHPEIGSRALKQMHDAYDVDANQERRIAGAIADLQKDLQSTAFSESERKELEAGVEKGMKDGFSRRSAAISAEKEWLDTLD